MDRVGTVLEVKGETVLVRMRRHLACEKCGRCGGILTSTDRKELILELPNSVKAEIGQQVLIEMDDRQTLFLSFMLYMVPILTLAAGIILWLQLPPHFSLAGSQELAAIAAGFFLMALVFAGIRIWDRRAQKSGKYAPVITRVVREEELLEGELN